MNAVSHVCGNTFTPRSDNGDMDIAEMQELADTIAFAPNPSDLDLMTVLVFEMFKRIEALEARESALHERLAEMDSDLDSVYDAVMYGPDSEDTDERNV